MSKVALAHAFNSLDFGFTGNNFDSYIHFNLVKIMRLRKLNCLNPYYMVKKICRFWYYDNIISAFEVPDIISANIADMVYNDNIDAKSCWPILIQCQDFNSRFITFGDTQITPKSFYMEILKASGLATIISTFYLILVTTASVPPLCFGYNPLANPSGECCWLMEEGTEASQDEWTKWEKREG